MADHPRAQEHPAHAKDWPAHQAAHDHFRAWVDGLHDVLDAPLEFHLLVVVLERDLKAHMRVENEQVLEAYARAVPDPPSSGAHANFLRDHEMLQDQLDDLLGRSLLAALGEPVGRHLPYTLVAFDKLLDHHDERELRHLYPGLAGALEADARQALETAVESAPRSALAEAGQRAREVAASDVFSSWTTLWRVWEQLRSGGDVAVPDAEVAAAAAAGLSSQDAPALAKLFVRDRNLVARFAATDFATPRERLHQERTVDQTLRSTLRFALARIV